LSNPVTVNTPIFVPTPPEIVPSVPPLVPFAVDCKPAPEVVSVEVSAVVPLVANGAAAPEEVNDTVGADAPLGREVFVGITVNPAAAVSAAFAPTYISIDAVPLTAVAVVGEVAKTVKFAVSSASANADGAEITEMPLVARTVTATAATFFNEIVFTIFLSFSQIKDDLLPGW
jgi:hypothetical protein